MENKDQLRKEIVWLKKKLETVKKEKHRKDLERQIKERELNLELGIYENQGYDRN